MDTIELSTILEIAIAALMLFNALVVLRRATRKVSIGSKILYLLQGIAYLVFPVVAFMPLFIPFWVKVAIETLILLAVLLSLVVNIRGKV